MIRASIVPSLSLGFLLAACVSNTPQSQFNGSQVSMTQASKDNTALGIKYLQQGNRDVAMQMVQKAIQQDPDNGDAYMAEALIYSADGEVSRADDAYHTALRKSSGDPEIQNNYAVFLCQHGKPKDSLPYFLQAANNPHYSTPDLAFTNAGVCAGEIPDKTAAEGYFRKALDMNPSLPEPLYQLAQMSYDQKKYLQARAFIQRFNTVTQPRPEVLLLGVQTEKALGNRQGAADYAHQLLKLFPTSTQAQQLDPVYSHGG